MIFGTKRTSGEKWWFSQAFRVEVQTPGTNVVAKRSQLGWERGVSWFSST